MTVVYNLPLISYLYNYYVGTFVPVRGQKCVARLVSRSQ